MSSATQTTSALKAADPDGAAVPHNSDNDGGDDDMDVEATSPSNNKTFSSSSPVPKKGKNQSSPSISIHNDGATDKTVAAPENSDMDVEGYDSSNASISSSSYLLPPLPPLNLPKKGKIRYLSSISTNNGASDSSHEFEPFKGDLTIGKAKKNHTDYSAVHDLIIKEQEEKERRKQAKILGDQIPKEILGEVEAEKRGELNSGFKEAGETFQKKTTEKGKKLKNSLKEADKKGGGERKGWGTMTIMMQ
jgi:hypothetical protein